MYARTHARTQRTHTHTHTHTHTQHTHTHTHGWRADPGHAHRLLGNVRPDRPGAVQGTPARAPLPLQRNHRARCHRHVYHRRRDRALLYVCNQGRAATGRKAPLVLLPVESRPVRLLCVQARGRGWVRACPTFGHMLAALHYVYTVCSFRRLPLSAPSLSPSLFFSLSLSLSLSPSHSLSLSISTAPSCPCTPCCAEHFSFRFFFSAMYSRPWAQVCRIACMYERARAEAYTDDVCVCVCVCGCVCERVRHSDRERERERETDRQRERKRERARAREICTEAT